MKLISFYYQGEQNMVYVKNTTKHVINSNGTNTENLGKQFLIGVWKIKQLK